MNKSTKNTTPMTATHPGKMLLDELETRGILQSDFAKLIGYKKSQLNEIIKGKRNVDDELAILLERELGINANFWVNSQDNYDLDIIRIDKRKCD
jgi:HTH-type transcriptional regulator/antitoxin HigA